MFESREYVERRRRDGGREAAHVRSENFPLDIEPTAKKVPENDEDRLPWVLARPSMRWNLG